MTVLPEINGARLLERLEAFARIGGTPAGGVNRPALGTADREARALLANLGRKRGFSVHQDGAANLFIRRAGADDARPPFLIGSHLDSQPTGGRYDGALGTLSAFEVLETLEDHGIVTSMAVEVVSWTNEEGCRFAPGAFGSRAFAEGRLPVGVDEVTCIDGAPLAGELASTLAALPGAVARPLGSSLTGYLELHIEQGPVLEIEGCLIGVVEGIQGTRWLEVVVEGQVAHAGTTPLSARRDALAAATDVIARLQATVMPRDERARLTVGRLALSPGAVNVIPGEVTFSIDLRHPEAAEVDRLEGEITRLSAEIAERSGCRIRLSRSMDVAPARFDPDLVDLVEAAAEARGYAHRRLFSGAFHDALFIARLAPAAMIFVPCRDGLSHNEAEYVEPHQVTAGAQILADTLLAALSRR